MYFSPGSVKEETPTSSQVQNETTGDEELTIEPSKSGMHISHISVGL